jgi:hypothetical protein
MRILIISDNDLIGRSILDTINNYDPEICSATLIESKFVDMKSELDIDSIIKNNDLVISAHCKKIFPKELTERIKCRKHTTKVLIKSLTILCIRLSEDKYKINITT